MKEENKLTSNFEQVMEVIGTAVYEYLCGYGELSKEERIEQVENQKLVDTFLNAAFEGYSLVPWPESQSFMEEDWFREEAILALGSEEQTGSSAYFIPIKRIVNGKG